MSMSSQADILNEEVYFVWCFGWTTEEAKISECKDRRSSLASWCTRRAEKTTR